jgi:hypothetical protein
MECASAGVTPTDTKCDPTEALAVILAQIHGALDCTRRSPGVSLCFSHELLG